MKEAAFVKQNRPRWEEFEQIIKDQHKAEPDRLAELFVQVTDDLSFSRTQYPNTRTTQYLNALASKLHLKIYKNKREDTNRFVHFWKHEIPEAMFEARKQLLYAFIVFMMAGVIGALSTIYDDTFVRLIMGDSYVNMTLENIKKGNPTDVYSSMDQLTMFFAITWNNVMVAFRIFVFGVFTSLTTGLYLFYNGLMVGAFVTFFYEQNQLSQALPVIMLHGTIELSSIVIAAAAGFVMGNSLVFPGTYSRIESFKRGAMTGIKILVGLVPFFIAAGFIESFVTRYAFMHWSVKIVIIGISAVIMIYYFVIYPQRLYTNGKFSSHQLSPDARLR
jgi:uncharacterized membrane protein SpoIIM required for sporulation